MSDEDEILTLLTGIAAPSDDIRYFWMEDELDPVPVSGEDSQLIAANGLRVWRAWVDAGRPELPWRYTEIITSP